MIWVSGALALLSVVSLSPGDSLRTDTVRAGRFGPVILYRYTNHPSNVVLFVSGSAGWTPALARMAETLAHMDALAVGIDIREYLRSLGRSDRCSYPAGDFEALNEWLQHKLGFAAYASPVLAGYSEGATLVYAALAQAPPNAFRGGISLGFCPVLEASRTFCRGEGLPSTRDRRRGLLKFGPAKALEVPWIVIQDQSDSACSASRVQAFVRQVRGADIMLLPRASQGLGNESRRLSVLEQAFRRLSQPPPQPTVVRPPEVQDLPLVELPVRDSARQLAVFVSGDGGWASLDRRIGETLAAHGVPVVGLNSLEYFWKRRTPDEAAAALTRIIRHYLEQWHASELILVGYSRGAEVLPFMVTRLPSDVRSRIRAVALLAPGRTADFEFHLTDLLGASTPGDNPTVPEIERLRGLAVLCVYGSDETDSACPMLPKGLATPFAVSGGHHFGGAYDAIARQILLAAGAS